MPELQTMPRVAQQLRQLRCVICDSPRLEPRFQVAFPEFGEGGRAVWPIGAEPDVPHWTIDACHECGVHFANPPPGPGLIEAFYAKQDKPNEWEQEHYVEATPDRTAHWSRFAEKITRLARHSGTLLEVGPAAGHLLRAALDQGWRVLGVEPTPKFTRILRERGLRVHQGTLATLETQESFDVVVMIDVIEHLSDPIADLARCRSLLAPDGWLVVATCDIGSFAARYYRLRWRQLVVSHTFYFTERSLRLALESAGFTVAHVAGVRWWDPDPVREHREWAVEFAKLMCRKVLQKTWMPVLEWSKTLQGLQAAFTRGRLDLPRMQHKLGDQAVMSDVILVVARSR